MASINLKDAFYHVPIHKNYRNYLTFFCEKYIKIVCMPNGYGPAMRMFTKISKVPFSILREEGHISIMYVDDSYLQGADFEDCFDNVLETIVLLRSLGFTINIEKSNFFPKQSITYLSFVLNSKNMTISLTQEKKEK